MGTASPNPLSRPCRVRRSRTLFFLFGALSLGLPAAATAAPLPVERYVRVLPAAEREIGAFYQARGGEPLWVVAGRLRPEAARVLDLVNGAEADGLDPIRYRPQELAGALAAASSGTPADLARAELLLSRAVALYARDLRRPGNTGMLYVDADLAPRAPSLRAVLDGLAAAPSLARGVEQTARLNPHYNVLRDAFAAELARGGLSAEQQDRVRASLERLRALPTDLGERYVLVDAASARLWMYQGDRAVGSMKVVIGRPGEQTPQLAAYIRNLTLNPYWNVPPDLVQRLIAPNVVEKGPAYLRTAGYEVLSDWDDEAGAREASGIDWKAVAKGEMELPVRQRPGPANSMGKMKFMFPNKLGVYLHDTPNRELFSEVDRRRSAGCVRLQDAPRLARWLFGREVKGSGAPEEAVPLEQKVPVYITYLTAMPERGRIVFHDDHYGRDRQLLASLGGPTLASR
jgi:L,D-transpeptidase YcbB